MFPPLPGLRGAARNLRARDPPFAALGQRMTDLAASQDEHDLSIIIDFTERGVETSRGHRAAPRSATRGDEVRSSDDRDRVG
jgi:hypothetical protein